MKRILIALIIIVWVVKMSVDLPPVIRNYEKWRESKARVDSLTKQINNN